DDPRAGVPAQEGVVVPRRANAFSSFEPAHRFTKTVVRVMTRSGSALGELRFRAALVEDAGVIGPLVFAFHAREQLLSLGVADAVTFPKTIRDREQQCDQRRLIFRIGLQDIETNALGLARLIE